MTARLLHCLLFSALSVATARAQTYTLRPFPLYGAGGAAGNGLFSVQGSVGQSQTSGLTLTGGGYSSPSGFWGPELLQTVSSNEAFQLTMVSTGAQLGQTATLPIDVDSPEGFSNLVLTVAWPANNFTLPSLTTANPFLLPPTILTNGSELTFSFQAQPGQIVSGAQEIAQLTFSPLPSQTSSFIPIPIIDVSAAKPYGPSYDNYVVQPATIALITGAPFLTAALAPGQTRVLNLYGRLGTNYQLQYATNLNLPIDWLPVADYTQSNSLITIPVPSSVPAIFYRIIQQ